MIAPESGSCAGSEMPANADDIAAKEKPEVRPPQLQPLHLPTPAILAADEAIGLGVIREIMLILRWGCTIQPRSKFHCHRLAIA